MDAKIRNFSEMANLLIVKSRVNNDLSVFFSHFSLGHMLSGMDMQKEEVQVLLYPPQRTT